MDKDPYIDWIPLSYPKYTSSDFSGYIEDGDGNLIAIARIYGSELGDVYVMEKYRGKTNENGVKWSNLILEKIIKASKRRKKGKLWLWTTRDNISAIKLYQKFNLIMTKKLENQIHEKYKWTLGKDLIYMEN